MTFKFRGAATISPDVYPTVHGSARSITHGVAVVRNSDFHLRTTDGVVTLLAKLQELEFY